MTLSLWLQRAGIRKGQGLDKALQVFNSEDIRAVSDLFVVYEQGNLDKLGFSIGTLSKIQKGIERGLDEEAIDQNCSRPVPATMSATLIMLGDSTVGKTTLLHRYNSPGDDFNPHFISTIGIDFRVTQVNVDGCSMRLRIWDTAGQERFRSITLSYFRGAEGILLVYDVTKRSTFDNIRTWMEQIEYNAGPNVATVLIGNKSDMEECRQVTQAEGQALAGGLQQLLGRPVLFFETSAKHRTNVDESFLAVAREVLARLPPALEKPPTSVDMTTRPQGSAFTWCCPS
jgi:Ras-related protein Rab-8A